MNQKIQTFKNFLIKKNKQKQQKQQQTKTTTPILYAGIERGDKPKTIKEDYSSPNKTYVTHSELVVRHKFNENHRAAIRAYTEESVTKFNNHLYEKEKMNLGMEHDRWAARSSPRNKALIKHLSSAISSNTAHKDIHTYTGLFHDPRKYFSKKETHTLVKMPAFTSTSLDPDRALKFAEKHRDNVRHVLKINIPQHARCGYVGDVSSHSHEKEMIIHHGAHLKIKTKPYKIHKTPGGFTHYHEADLIHDGVEYTSLHSDKK